MTKISSTQHAITQKIDQRLDSLVTKPLMWGDLEAVELQALQLLEIRSIVLNPMASKVKDRWVQRHWIKYLKNHYPEALPGTLATYMTYRIFEQNDIKRAELKCAEITFIKVLKDFIEDTVDHMDLIC